MRNGSAEAPPCFSLIQTFALEAGPAGNQYIPFLMLVLSMEEVALENGGVIITH